MDLRKLKDKASEAFNKKSFAKAAELYEELLGADPKDHQARLRMGDAWAKAGKRDKAISAYAKAAEGFAKEGFLPRAIAASKLILELDPSHQGVQKMLADLYARKAGPPAPPKGAGAVAIGVEQKVPTSATDAAFTHRKDAIDLDAPAPQKPAPARRPAPGEPPSPTTRADAIDLPEYEIPGMEPEVQGSVSVPMAAKGPSPTRNVHALDFDEGPQGPAGPADLVETSIDLGMPAAPAPVMAKPSGPPTPGLLPHELDVPIEIETPSQENEVPIEGIEVSVEPSAPRPPARPPPPPPPSAPEPAVVVSHELMVDEPPPPPRPSGPEVPLIVDPEPIADDVPAPRPSGPDLAIDIDEGEPEVSAPGVIAESPTVLVSPLATETDDRIVRSGEGEAPPGLRPKPKSDVPPAPPRIWLPGAEPIAAQPVAASEPEGSTDLERSLEIFSRFEANDFQAPPPPAPKAATPARKARSFTELELEGDSLLHAVEEAAVVGLHQRGQNDAVLADGLEEPMEAPEELKPTEGGAAGLPKIPLFSDLPSEAFIALFERCPLRRVGPGEVVIQQGSLGDAFYVICAGSVRVFRIEGERRRELATLEEGAFFGEMALLSGSPRTASVEGAVEDTQLLEISAAILTELSHRHPQVASALKKFCRQRLLSNVMATAPLFQPFSRQDRKDLVQRFRARDVNKGEVLINEGRSSDGMYVILSGEVEVRVKDQAVAQLKEGDLFGEMSLLTKSKATATVAAAKRTSLLRLPREDFDMLIMSHPQVLVLVSELTEARQKQNAALPTPAAAPGDATPLV